MPNKNQGFRVELDGVTAVVEKVPGIPRACAIVADGKLSAFYTADNIMNEADLVEFCSQHLPFYSVPDRWIYVPAIPLTPNGKVDKRKLQQLSLPAVITKPALAAVITKPEPVAIPADLAAAVAIAEGMAIDLEKGEKYDSPVTRSSMEIAKGGVASITDSYETIPEQLPAKKGYHGQRWLRHRAFIVYRRFMSMILLSNIAVACFLLYKKVNNDREILGDVVTAFAANLCVAVLMRSEPMVNLMFTLACSVPTSWPLAIRRHAARVFHIGKHT